MIVKQDSSFIHKTLKFLLGKTLACLADSTFVSCRSCVIFQRDLRECGRITFLEIKATIRIDPSSEIRDRGKYVVAAVRNRLWSAEQIMDGGKRQILHGGRHKSSPAFIRANRGGTHSISSLDPKQDIDYQYKSREVFSLLPFASCETDRG